MSHLRRDGVTLAEYVSISRARLNYLRHADHEKLFLVVVRDPTS